MNLMSLTAVELGKKIKSGEVTAVEATKAALEQIKKLDGTYNCYVTVDEEAALKEAEEVQKKIEAGELTGPLAGVPVAVKDNMCTEGMLTTCSSKILYDQSAKILDEDNFLIWKVRKEIIVSRNDFNRTFSQFCNIFFVSFRIPKMDQLLKWIFPLNSFLNSCMSSMRITHDQNFHLFHPSLFTKLSLHSDFICQSISSSRTHVRLGA